MSIDAAKLFQDSPAPATPNAEWTTPPGLFKQLDREFNFTLDPCATADNALCEKFYTIEDDGLSKSWAGERVFMNPPYGKQTAAWVRKAHAESMRGALVVCLLQAATDVAWFHDYCLPFGEIRFQRGRLKYGDGKGQPPWGSMVVVFRPAGVNHAT